MLLHLNAKAQRLLKMLLSCSVPEQKQVRRSEDNLIVVFFLLLLFVLTKFLLVKLQNLFLLTIISIYFVKRSKCYYT